MKRISFLLAIMLLILSFGCTGASCSCAGKTDNQGLTPEKDQPAATAEVLVSPQPEDINEQDKTETNVNKSSGEPTNTSETTEGKEITTEPTEEPGTEPQPLETGVTNEMNANMKEDAPASVADIPTGTTEYEKYYAMSSEEQKAFFNSFDSPEAFFEWLNAAREEYEKSYETIVVGEDPIDVQNYVNDN